MTIAKRMECASGYSSTPKSCEQRGGFNRFAHSAGPSYFGCLPGGLLVCCLCVCLYVLSIVESSCAQFGSLSWGPFGLHFGSSGGRLGTILGSVGSSWVDFGELGLPWAPFLGLWDSSGAFGAPWGPPLAAQGAQSQIVLLFSLPFWAHFGSMLAPCWRVLGWLNIV